MRRPLEAVRRWNLRGMMGNSTRVYQLISVGGGVFGMGNLETRCQRPDIDVEVEVWPWRGLATYCNAAEAAVHCCGGRDEQRRQRRAEHEHGCAVAGQHDGLAFPDFYLCSLSIRCGCLYSQRSTRRTNSLDSSNIRCRQRMPFT